MSFSLSNRALLRGMLAGAVILTGTACSRSDRAKSGPNNTAAVVPDTSSNATQPSLGATQPSLGDTVTGATTSAPSNTPRAETAAPSGKDAAGYRSMERDTTNAPSQRSDSASATAEISPSSSASADVAATNTDTASISASAGVADTAAAGYAEMARDTSTVADQADTAAANGDVALSATVDTSSEASAGVSETSVAAAGAADKPAEDSTEVLGNVTTNEAADETADEQVVRPEDRETVAASEARTDEVGAAAIGGNVTGAEAGALMSREGVRCAIVDPEANEAVRWDMSNTPVALNPCGMGSMNLSKIWTRVE